MGDWLLLAGGSISQLAQAQLHHASNLLTILCSQTAVQQHQYSRVQLPVGAPQVSAAVQLTV
jgi:hypothetical protein